MTTIATKMSNNNYWDKIACDPSFYFDEFPVNLVNNLLFMDMDYVNSYESLIKEESEGSLSPDEADQHQPQASSTNSPPTESCPVELICAVCGAPAHGYNFDQITCESCKAFFRRNALKNTPYLKCRFSGSCTVNINTRRQCTYCRLKKCFDAKMRKEWIRTDEERELRRLKNLNKTQKKLNKSTADPQPILDLPIVMRKKKRIQLPTTSSAPQELALQKIVPIYPVKTFSMHRNLSAEDTNLFNNIINAYKFGADQADCSHIARYNETSKFSQFINDETKMHQSLIHFFKRIPEFKQLDLEIQILLIKSNLVDIIHLHHIIVQNFQEIPQIGTQMSKWISGDFHQQMSRTRGKFDCFMKYPLVLQLAMTVFVFSINLSTPRTNNHIIGYDIQRKLYEIQNFYTSILWRYLNYLFDENEAVRSMHIIVMQILRYQTLMDTMDELVRQNNDYDIFSPLMQSVFGLT